MPRLFFKIFLWFWLGVVILSATLVLSSALMRSRSTEDERWRQKYWLTVHLRAQHAIELFEQGRATEASELLSQLEQRDPMRNYIFDSGGHEVYGAQAPASVRKIQTLIGKDPEAGPRFFPVERIGAETYATSGGKPYLFIMTFPKPSIFPPSLVIFLFEDVGREGIIRFATILAVGAFFCFCLARHITGPIDQLRLATRRISQGLLETRIGKKVTRRSDELGDLGRDFDHMAERIDSLVTGERRFLADVSHTLRSPLARMNVALGLARRCAPYDVATHLDRIENEADRLNKLIGDLLTMAKMDSGVALEERKIVDLGALLLEIAADGDYEARNRQCGVRLDPSFTCLVEGAPEMLRCAIENVVRNAVQHTSPGTTVEIAMGSNGRWPNQRAFIHVRDHGDGIPEDELAGLFVRFRRAQNSVRHDSSGTGLGLAIAERALLLHSGRVAAANARGGGLIVTLELPMLTDANQSAQIHTANLTS